MLTWFTFQYLRILKECLKFDIKSLVDDPHKNRWYVGDWSNDSDQTIHKLISLSENKREVSISLLEIRGKFSISLTKNREVVSISLTEKKGKVGISLTINWEEVSISLVENKERSVSHWEVRSKLNNNRERLEFHSPRKVKR